MPENLPLAVDTKRLRDLRLDRKLTHLQVAQALGYRSHIGYLYIENGHTQPSAVKIAQLAALYEVPMESLFCAVPE